MADRKSSKHTPFKKNTPTKSPKPNTPNRNLTPKREYATTYETPTKKQKLSLYEPSPTKSLEALYRSLKEAQTKLKQEVNELFRRLSSVGNDQPIDGLLLDDPPLLKLYDIFMDMKLGTTQKDQEGSSSLFPVVLTQDSSSDV
ncbi:hypothetical protein SASPL_105803 [Salvia splendens]|uniref:Uncharacterized protein n=1 Tax=Salvia splendens TaxID=180675 RepID=A0A4D8Y671_SALSN|nr:hypothetical protein SASPL_144666 [Salvia splendens]KAG6402595.1 hypothetical protein SASPL_134792 [Salvia splendens]KAG6407468.1 hypothetical protein SASPL_130459 [Salvia splendens]KAG6417904.1 hypothetical protein SASPL_120101 [Salvia splendens]KAG6426399.1 hypothetical protein SASPL_110622 [Salvia splendens]